MSEPKLISPLLDGFMMGPSMSAHPGVRSCPAMPQDSDKRYIVKIISIPASTEQLEALLLTGAFANQESALAYFKDQAQRTIDEIGVLKNLSSLEGFVPFEGHQLVEKEGEPGYELYILSPYKTSLEQQLNRHTMTQLNAVNLGLDMCASLAVCRRAGYLYVNLKPENIFMSEDKEFRIGDLGFVSMDSLKYTSLDERYHSPYSAPECSNVFETLNTTVDTYAAGMILYQTYNDGFLPSPEDGDQLPPPQYADYEMAEIIMKAIDPNPANRWKDPIAMGQAIVAYMQKNGANDLPIVPVAIPAEPKPAVPIPSEEEEEIPDGEIPAEEIAEDPSPAESEEAATEDAPAQEEIAKDFTQNTSEEDESKPLPIIPAIIEDDSSDDDLIQQIQLLLGEEDSSQDALVPEPATEAPVEISAFIPAAEETCEIQEPSETPAEEDAPAETAEEAPELDPDDPTNLSFMQLLVSDETAPSEDMAAAFGYDELSQDANDILALADELLMHETPAGVVAPEPIDVPAPPPIMLKAEPDLEPITAIDSDYQPPAADQQAAEDEQSYSEEDYEEGFDDDFEDLPSSFSWKKIAIAALIIALIGAICLIGYNYFNKDYVLKIDSLNVVGSGNSISVQVDSDIKDELITIECIDNNGTKQTSQVVDGYAEFTDLNPDTLYRIYVKVSGNHKVKGDQEARYTTPKITNVISFTAVAGAEDGSATLRFKVDGQTAKSWKVAYSTEGEPELVKEFTEDMVTVTGLTVGKTYTFRLQSDDAVYIVGNHTLEYTAKALVMAQDVQITSCDNGKLTVQWAIPEGQSVSSWSVRCYNEDIGYNETVTTSGNSAEFALEDTSKGYTVAVTAEGMTTPTRAFLKPGSITVREFKVDDSDPTKLTVSWNYGGPAPEGEWLLMYNVEGKEQTELVRTSMTDSVVIQNKVPNATYHFTISTQSGVTVFNDTHSVTTKAAPSFDKYKIKAKDIVFRMCVTPEKANWTYRDVETVTNTFKAGQKASFTMSLLLAPGNSYDAITIMYVIRDGEGKVLSNDTQTTQWIVMWKDYRGELDVPALPTEPGNYTIEIYFNGCSVFSEPEVFTITQ